MLSSSGELGWFGDSILSAPMEPEMRKNALWKGDSGFVLVRKAVIGVRGARLESYLNTLVPFSMVTRGKRGIHKCYWEIVLLSDHEFYTPALGSTLVLCVGLYSSLTLSSLLWVSELLSHKIANYNNNTSSNFMGLYL